MESEVSLKILLRYDQTSKLGQIFTCAEDFLTEFQKFNLKFI